MKEAKEGVVPRSSRRSMKHLWCSEWFWSHSCKRWIRLPSSPQSRSQSSFYIDADNEERVIMFTPLVSCSYSRGFFELLRTAAAGQMPQTMLKLAKPCGKDIYCLFVSWNETRAIVVVSRCSMIRVYQNLTVCIQLQKSSMIAARICLDRMD